MTHGRFFVDTNLFLRYLTKDDPGKFGRCRELFKKAVEDEVSLHTSEMVVAELVWTLLSYYKVPKAEVIEKVSIIISTPNLHVVNKTIIADSLILYSQKNIDFIDAYNALFMKFHGLGKIYSYDQDFDSIGGIEREEP
jgi:predicted nucleic acid-binding protein